MQTGEHEAAAPPTADAATGRLLPFNVQPHFAWIRFKPNGLREGLPAWSLTLLVATFSAVTGIVTLGWMLIRG